LNPGPPAPQADVLILTRLRAHSTSLLRPETDGRILNTLIKLRSSGLEEQTVKIIGYYLKHIAFNVDLDNPEIVKASIANKECDNGFKGNLVKAYNYYALINSIVWDRPKYKWEWNKPKIPTEESLNKIIASAGWKYSVVFTLLKETSYMPKELGTNKRRTFQAYDAESNLFNLT
jgi:hypothetical protein